MSFSTCNGDIQNEEVGGYLTDVLRLGDFSEGGTTVSSTSPSSQSMSSLPTENIKDKILIFVVPGNPGTLAFYKGIVDVE